MGTIAYMSPEQAEGKTTDERADIFALGIIFYEMLAKRHPFPGETVAAILSRIMRETPPSLDEVDSRIPHELARIVRRCLEKEPTRRYQNAIDLRNDLEEVQQDIASGALAARRGRPPEPGWRKLVPWGVAAVAAAAAIALIPRGGEVPEPPVRRHVFQPPPSTPIRGRPWLSPDGSHLFFRAERDGERALYVRALDELTPRLVPGTERPASGVSFSPDRNWLGFSDHRTVRKVPFNGGEIANEVREILAELGARSLADVVGRTEWLEARTDLHGKPALVDLSRVLAPPGPRARRFAGDEPSTTEASLDERVLERLRFSAVAPEPLAMQLPIANIDRSVGARIAGEFARRYSSSALPNGLVRLTFRGSAGQSFGAFAVSGMRLELEGEANDGLGKGLCGGELVVRSREASVLAGNAALYGATGGALFLAGRAGERFAVRNSGAVAVVEGLGDHGCEYMTDGAVIVLGSVGRNFAAGMSGGVAFVLDEPGANLNDTMVSLSAVTSEDIAWLAAALERHHAATGSTLAARLLDDWRVTVSRFRRVTPRAAPSRPLPEYRDRAVTSFLERHHHEDASALTR